MAVSAFPAIVDALVAQAPTVLPAGVATFDGLPGSDDDADFLSVGIPSIEGDNQANAGGAEQSWGGTGTGASRAEVGTVNCLAAAHSTDETVKSARDRAFAIAEAVAALCRAGAGDLGIAQVVWTDYGGQMNAYQVVEPGQPVGYVVEFQVGYQARL